MPSDPPENALDKAVAVSPEDQSPDRTQSDADQVLNSDRLDELIATSRELTKVSAESVAAARDEVIAGRKQRRRFGILIIGLGIAIVVALAGVYVSMQAGHANGKQNTELSRTNSRLLKVIRSCVEPTGKCYRDAQARTGNVVRSLNNAAVTDAGLAAACAPNYVHLPIDKRIVAIHACILRNLK